jgi:hypothetical protein
MKHHYQQHHLFERRPELCLAESLKTTALGQGTIRYRHSERNTSSTHMKETQRSFEDCSKFLLIFLLGWWEYVRKGGGKIGCLRKLMPQESLFPA